jgi:hypothetical protein
MYSRNIRRHQRKNDKVVVNLTRVVYGDADIGDVAVVQAGLDIGKTIVAEGFNGLARARVDRRQITAGGVEQPLIGLVFARPKIDAARSGICVAVIDGVDVRRWC